MANFYWTTDVEEAKGEQRTLADLVEIKKSTFNLARFNSGLAIGTAYEENTKRAFAVCVMFDKNGNITSDFIETNVEVNFSYIAGLLVFRVGHAICLALDQVPDKVDLFLFDGQGIAHPLGFGLASHIGVLFNKPSIGITKKALFGRYHELPEGKWHTELKHPKTKTTIGYCISSDDNNEPFFMSPGHQITLTESLEVMQMIAKDNRLPRPIRVVHARANSLAREYWNKIKKSK